LKVNSATTWFLLYGCIMMHGQQNIKYIRILYFVLVLDIAKLLHA